MNPHAPIPSGATIAGRYEIVATLGEGASSVVYEARMRPMMRRVALKVLRPDIIARPEAVEYFLRAGRLLSEVDHPHLVTTLDVGVADGVPFLTMEVLDGETLSTRIQRGGRIALSEALTLLLPIASAVVTLHERGVVHGDLKPSSILLARQATGHVVPKLLDLGVASVGGGLPVAGSVAARYLAPEVASGRAKVDARSDQWALAMLLWESLTGRTLFQIGALPGIDPRLELSLARALERDPSRRFESVGAFARSLLPLLDDSARARWVSVFGAPTEPPPEPAIAQTIVSVDATMVAPDPAPLRLSSPSPGARPAAPRSAVPTRRRWVIPAALAGVLLVGAGVVAAVSGGAEPSREAGASAARTTYSVALRTEPIFARIDLDGEYVSAGVLLREFPRDGRSHTLRVYATGYEPQMLTFANVGPGELVTLAPLGARVAPSAGSGSPGR